MSRGLDESGQELPSERLVRLAAMAAAFLEVTNADVRHFLTPEQELEPIATFILGVFAPEIVAKLSSALSADAAPNVTATSPTVVEFGQHMSAPVVVSSSNSHINSLSSAGTSLPPTSASASVEEFRPPLNTAESSQAPAATPAVVVVDASANANAALTQPHKLPPAMDLILVSY